MDGTQKINVSGRTLGTGQGAVCNAVPSAFAGARSEGEYANEK